MATTYKVLGQSYPAATTPTTLYTVPSSKSAVVSTISVCNTGSTQDTIRISVRIGGASATDAQYIAYGDTVAPGSTYALTIGITLATTDVVTIYSTTGTSAFNAFGSEI